MNTPLVCALVLVFSVSSAFAAPLAPGKIIRDASYAPEMVVIPAGQSVLGSTPAETMREGRAPAYASYEQPQRQVRFDEPFAVGRYHVTKRQFAAFAKAVKRPMDGCIIAANGKWSEAPLPENSYAKVGFRQRQDEPALCVNWDDANAYAAWLSQKTGARYRLLTEDEWEYAARGGVGAARWWGDDVTSICKRVNGGDQLYAVAMPADKTANLACADGFTFTNPVNYFAPNPFGLSDMFGNAWQWVADCFSPKPGAPSLEAPCKARSIRGGSWHNSTATLRAATRFSLPPDMRSSSIGFRVMRELH